jgi:hypothetical protein
MVGSEKRGGWASRLSWDVLQDAAEVAEAGGGVHPLCHRGGLQARARASPRAGVVQSPGGEGGAEAAPSGPFHGLDVVDPAVAVVVVSQGGGDGPVGCAVTPRMCTRRLATSITNSTCSRRRVTVSTQKKSVANNPAACVRRNVRQLGPPRRGAGPTRALARIRRMVPAPTRWPSRRSSPWIRRCPHNGFSRANRSVRSRTSSLTRGRPGRLGYVHLLPTSRRCQASRVGDDPLRPQLAGQQPRQRGQHRTIRPRQPRPADLAAQHGHLMPQYDDLDVLRGVGSGQQRQPAQHPQHAQVQHPHSHNPRSCRATLSGKPAGQHRCTDSGTVQARIQALIAELAPLHAVTQADVTVTTWAMPNASDPSRSRPELIDVFTGLAPRTFRRLVGQVEVELDRQPARSTAVASKPRREMTVPASADANPVPDTTEIDPRRRAPLEHRTRPAAVPIRRSWRTSGLHAAPGSASEHRSSTGTSTVDRQTILPTAYVQVRDLLRVRRQVLEPRTRGLRGQSSPIRRTTTSDSACPYRRSTGSPGTVGR